uniref:PGG domain-containing protein n=1 Tax=Ananas comosus var. bracteatus TaxID=296719 RepID=A0A6V7PJN8_ANACO|nr:unnamed protein product [Ananas comosus var. bracteatus]
MLQKPPRCLGAYSYRDIRRSFHHARGLYSRRPQTRRLANSRREIRLHAFVGADTLAFIYSVAATIKVLYVGSQAVDPFRWVEFIVIIQDFIAIAAQLMVVAFSMSVYVLLAPLSKFIAIFCCAVPLLFTVTFPAWPAWDLFLLAKVITGRLGLRGQLKYRAASWPRDYILGTSTRRHFG